MYNRRVVVFSRQDQAYARYGSLCGVASFVVKEGKTEVSVLASNLDFQPTQEWWGIAMVDGVAYKSKLDHFNNFCFDLPTTNLYNVAFLLVLAGNPPVVVAQNYLGNGKINAIGSAQLQQLLASDLSGYEQFVATTNNFYSQDGQVDVAKLKEKSRQKYLALQDYSSAFEKYYATGRGDNYLQSVQSQLHQLFESFPPYYPLINKYEQSYFVRIDFPKGEGFFVVGLLCKDKQPRYICYALPGDSQSLCDKDFTFVEKDGKGFWMLCQDAQNGQITTLKW